MKVSRLLENTDLLKPSKIRKTSFAVDVLRLASGTIFAQAITVLAMPIVTRLYSPDAFGLTSLFTSIVSVIAAVTCFRYELSIMLPKKDEDSANLLALSIFSVFLVSFLTVLIMRFWHKPLLDVLNAPSLGPYLWLISPAVFLNGIYLAFNYWNSRKKRFTHLSFARIMGSFATTSSRLGVGFAGYATGGGMIYSAIIGYVASTLMLGKQIWHEDNQLLKSSINRYCIFAGLKRYKNFPLFDTWAVLLSNLSWLSPTFLLSMFFSSTIVGYYALGMMVLQFPMSLIGGAISQVFFQRAAEAKSYGTLNMLVENTVLCLGMIGLLPTLLLTIVGKEIFIVVFGSQWAEAGVYTQILALYIFFLFITSPISTLFSVLEMQRTSLLINIIIFPVRGGALIIGGVLGDARISIILFSICNVVIYACANLYLINKAGVGIWNLLNKFTRFVAYSSPIIILIILIKWIVGLNSLGIVLISTFFAILYFIIFIKTDKVLYPSILQLFKDR